MSHINEKKHSDKRAVIFESNSPASDPYAQNEPRRRREPKIGTATDFKQRAGAFDRDNSMVASQNSD